jgi:hypothetical protein
MVGILEAELIVAEGGEELDRVCFAVGRHNDNCWLLGWIFECLVGCLPLGSNVSWEAAIRTCMRSSPAHVERPSVLPLFSFKRQARGEKTRKRQARPRLG